MPTAKTNVLMFVMDDQSPGMIHHLGNPDISTPALDELAKSGVYLRPHSTVPVCTPSRAEILTGCNAFQNDCRWFGEPIRPSLTLLPQALTQAGYHCCHIGKWHNDGHPRDRGFHETHCVFAQDNLADYEATDVRWPGHEMAFEEAGGVVRGHSTELFCDAARRFLDSAPRHRPWFCYVALHSPHDPRCAPQPWAGMYRDPLPPPPENFMPEHPFDNGDMLIRDERLAGFPRTQDEIRRHRADYYAMISHHDHHIGLVLRRLEELGERENTLVVFVSDHGLAVGSHGLMGKENLYEHSMRVPLILSGPGLPRDRRLDRTCLCGHYDLMPTMLDYLGLDIPASVRGISYLPVLRDETATMRSSICAAYRDCMRMATDGRFKLIHYPHLPRYQLFDLRNDPHELNDLLTPWRRVCETRMCPPPAPERERAAPDDRREVVHSLVNPPYTPCLDDRQVDAVMIRLRGMLETWQSEMRDEQAAAAQADIASEPKLAHMESSR